ncbi:MAG: hypothetical protein E6R03_15165 [Hyphomicrobiaceae bacterium]|nr:MAG: hypothetical protein E6R03_15165 [Hyphomicrobiaceae bacterium]
MSIFRRRPYVPYTKRRTFVPSRVASSLADSTFTASASIATQTDTTFTASASTFGFTNVAFTASASIATQKNTTLTASASIATQRDSTLTASASSANLISSTLTASASIAGRSDVTLTASASLVGIATANTTFTASASTSGDSILSFTAVASISLPQPVTPTFFGGAGNGGIGGTTYDFWLFDRFGNVIRTLNADVLSATYVRVVNDVGSLTMTFSPRIDPNVFKRDYGIRVYRKTARGGTQLEMDAHWFIRTIRYVRTDDGVDTIEVGCVCQNHILRRRIVAYNAESSQSKKTDNADDMMRAVIRENFSSSATDTARRVGSLYLTVGADRALGPSISQNFERKTVIDALRNIAQASFESGTPLYFDMVPASDALQFDFSTFIGQRGSDRTTGSSVVPIGPQFRNVGAYSLTEDANDEANFIYAGGEGQEGLRLIATAEDTSRSQIGPFSRIERWVDAKSTNNTNALTAEARSALYAGRPRIIFEGRILNTDLFQYGIDWGWADRVTVSVRNFELECRVIGVQISLGANGEEKIDGVLKNDE